MTQLTLHLPESAFATMHQAPNEFALEKRVAAVKWYELGRVSQGRAAEIAGLTRAALMDALSRYRVSPFQYTAQELAEEQPNRSNQDRAPTCWAAGCAPLHAFLAELHQCAGAPDLMPGDVVTTGTCTNAWPVRRGERWSAQFGAPPSHLQVEFS